jgi:hydrophobic/amphiphilic exporter-1 (mainly G- bacteria), HAE1 family
VLLTRFCIKNPIVVSMFFIALAVFGVISYRSLGASLNPNVVFPLVLVTANYPGASPSEMERLIVKPIEDQMDGIDNLDRISAIAQEGTAAITVQFKLDTNLDYAAIDVQRRVDTARVYMPTDLDPPTVDKSEGSVEAPILALALSSKTLSDTALADLINERIVSELKRIPDIQSVDVSGTVKREFEVEPNPGRLQGTGTTLSDVFNAVAANNANLPGGRLDQPTTETSVSVHGEINRASDILGIPLPNPIPNPATGLPAATGLRIGDVAHASDGHVDQRIVAHYDGYPTVNVNLNRIVTSDEIRSTAIARARVAEIAKHYPQVTFREIVAPADFTQASLNGVLQSLFEGIVLTALVLMLFLHAWRNALVVMIAIPSSLLATFIMMRVLNFTLDSVSLMGLSLTIGILVDDSIVVLENITRHRDLGETPVDAAIAGRGEIGGAAVAITLVDVVVFLPIAFLSGIVGKFMKEFGIVVVVATLFSLFVSFTLTPMLAARWSVRRRRAAAPKWAEWFQNGFDRLLRWYSRRALPFALRRRWQTVALCLALVLSAASLLVPFKVIQSEFVPSVQIGSIQMTVTYPVGTPLYKTQAGINRLEQAILKLRDVDLVLSTTGIKPAGFGTITGGHVALLRVATFKNRRRETDRIVREIRGMNALVAGAVMTVSAEGNGAGGGDPLYFTLSGPEDEIGSAADKLAAFIRTVPGTVNVQTGAESEGPRLNVNIDRARCALLGVAPGDAATAARVAVGGAVATRVRTDNGLVDVRVRLPEAFRENLDELGQIRVRANSGAIYRLGDVASFEMTAAPTQLERLDKERVIRVTGGIDPGVTTLGTVIGKIDAATKQAGFFPAGVGLRASGDSQFFQETFSSMTNALFMSFSLVYVLLVILYSSFLTPFVIMFSVPVAIVGALYGLAVTHSTLNLFSMIGIIMLFGLVAKNGILLVDYAKTLRRRGLRAHDAMLAAAETRFRPIIMTTASMVFGMLPLALGLAEGAEFRRSMGVVLIGGLLSSLILTLFLVPVIDVWIVGGIERRADRKAAEREHAPDVDEAQPQLEFLERG